jgi:membrane fusion protein, multidrug efflux system
MRRVGLAIAFVALLAVGGVGYRMILVEPARSQTPPRPAPAVPVLVAPVERQTVPIRLEAIGAAQPMATVGVKSRLDAQIAEVRVRDGQYVKAGDVLFKLDSRAAEAQLHQSEAQLARDKANLAFAQQQVRRFTPLEQKSFVSREQLDQAMSNQAAQEAAVQSDLAAIENAKVLLSYYTITTPIDGRLGMVTQKIGNNVKANDVPFLSINQVKPIYVIFSLAERELPGIRAAMAAGTVPVAALPAGDKGAPAKGRLAFFENTVDAATGTIAMRAVFDNEDERLWPGEFVNVTVTLGSDAEALTVPQGAVQIGQASPFLFVVKEDNTVEARKIEPGRTVDGRTVIAAGVAAGERIVVDGQLRLSNGSRVEIRAPQDKPAGKTS